MSLADNPDLANKVFIVSLKIFVSAFSQLFSPQNSSSKHLSKYWARGPSDSLGPTIEAVFNIVGGWSNFKVWLPNFFFFFPF